MQADGPAQQLSSHVGKRPTVFIPSSVSIENRRKGSFFQISSRTPLKRGITLVRMKQVHDSAARMIDLAKTLMTALRSASQPC